MPLICSGRSPPVTLIPGPAKSYTALASSTLVCSRHTLNLGMETEVPLPPGKWRINCTIRSGCG